MAHIRLIALMFAVVVVAGCNSGSSHAPAAAGPGTEEVEKSGHWGGNLGGEIYLYGNIDASFRIGVLLSEDFQFRILQMTPTEVPETYMLLRGTYSLEGSWIEGTGIAIAAPGETWSNGEAETGISIFGTLLQPTTTSNGRLLVAVAMDSGDTGRIDATFAVNGAYWISSELADLAGKWFAIENDNGSWHPDAAKFFPDPATMTVAVVDITPDGRFIGTEDLGCQLSGQFSVIDQRFGLWKVDYTSVDCDRSGAYSGLALGDLEPSWYPIPSLFVTADDGTHSQALEFWRLEPSSASAP